MKKIEKNSAVSVNKFYYSIFFKIAKPINTPILFNIISSMSKTLNLNINCDISINTIRIIGTNNNLSRRFNL